MKNYCALLLSLLAVSASAQTNEIFKVISEQTICPEYGTVSQRPVLLCNQLRIPFCTLDGWKPSCDAATRTIRFEALEGGSLIRLRLILPVPAATNAPAAKLADPNLKESLAQLVAGAQLLNEGVCAVAGGSGQMGDFTVVNGGRQLQGRLALLAFPQCQIEVMLTTPAALKLHHVNFTRLVNSITVQPIPPAAPAGS